MIGLRVDHDLYLSMPLERHTQPLYDLTHTERDRLRRWITGPDSIHNIDDQRADLARQRQALANGSQYPFIIEAGPDVAGTLNGCSTLIWPHCSSLIWPHLRPGGVRA